MHCLFAILAGNRQHVVECETLLSAFLLTLFAQPQVLRSSMFLGWARGLRGVGGGGEVRSIHWTCDLELSSFLSLTSDSVRHSSLLTSFKSKLKTRLFSTAH